MGRQPNGAAGGHLEGLAVGLDRQQAGVGGDAVDRLLRLRREVVRLDLHGRSRVSLIALLVGGWLGWLLQR